MVAKPTNMKTNKRVRRKRIPRPKLTTGERAAQNKERQQQWAINRKHTIREHLFQLGQSFDLQ